MSTEIDPRIVREVAEVAFRSTDGGGRAERVEAALIAADVAGPVLGKKFDAYSEAVGAEYDRLAGAAEPGTTRMSDDRLAELDQRITNGCDTYDCSCDNAPCGLEPREARELLAEVKRLRTLETSLKPEWGYRNPGEKSATPAPGEKYAREMAERRREQVATRLRTEWTDADA